MSDSPNEQSPAPSIAPDTTVPAAVTQAVVTDSPHPTTDQELSVGENNPSATVAAPEQVALDEAPPIATVVEKPTLDAGALAALVDQQAQADAADDDAYKEVPLEDQPADEVYAGEFTPNANVEEVLPVIDEITDEEIAHLAKNGSVYLPNLSLDEIVQIYDVVNRKVLSAQYNRRELALIGKADDFHELELPGTNNILYLTEVERSAMAAIQAYRKNCRQGLGRNIFNDGSTWTNLPSVGDTKIAIGKNDHSTSKDPILRMRGKLGMSTEYPTPLWGSGLNLVLESPGALDQLRLETRLLLDKVDYGRESVGYSYSAAAVYLNREVGNFILDHVTRSSCGITDPEELKKMILLTDLEPMAGAAASSIFPDGYLLERPCLKSNGGCGYVVARKVNVRRMMFVSTSRLTEHQMALMAKRKAHVDPSIIMNYQRAMRPEITRYIDLDGNYKLKMAIPTLAEYERVASAWMERLQQRARELVSSNANKNEREAYLAKASQLALIMAYGHWIESVVELSDNLDGDEIVHITRDVGESTENQYDADMAMDKFLEDLSADSGKAQAIVRGIEVFINAMTVSTIAVPKVICPGCNKPISGDSASKHPHLVSVNAIELFFTLLRHKIQNAGR